MESGGCSKWWRLRTNLEKTLIALSIILFLTSIIVILVSVTRQGSNSSEKDDDNRICITRNCIETAGDVISMADFTVDPCDDFFKHACGQYLSTQAVPLDRAVSSVEQKSSEAVRLKLKHWLDSASGNNVSVYKKVKVVYSTCMDYGKPVELSHSVLEKAIEEAKFESWPAFDRFWRDEVDSMERKLASLTLLGVPVAFQLKVVPDSENAGRYVAHISPGRPFFLNRKADDVHNDLMLKSYIGSVFLLLGATKHTASEDADDVVSLEASLIKFKELADNDCGDIQKDHKGDLLTVRLNDFQEMNTYIPYLNWTRLKNDIFGGRNFTVELYCRRYIKEYVGHLQELSPKIVHNYLGWRFLHSFVQHLGRQFYILKTNYQAHVTDADGPLVYQSRWKECLSILEDHMLPVIAAAYKENEVSDDVLKEKMKIASAVRSGISEFLSSAEWLDDYQKDWLKKKVLEAKFEVVLAKMTSRIEEIEEWFSDLHLTDESLVLNYVRIRQFEAKKELEKLTSPLKPRLDWDSVSFTSSSHLQHRESVIVVHFDKIREPYLSVVNPSYLNYGAFATYLVQELLRYVSTLDVPIRGRDNSSFWDVMEARKNMSICRRELSLMNKSVTGNKKEERSVLHGVLTDLQAIRSAYKAFKQQKKEDYELPGLKYSSEQMFFLSYAQSFCEVLDNDKHRRHPKNVATLSSLLRINLVLRNFKEFSQVFGCTKSGAMNPTSRCELGN